MMKQVLIIGLVGLGVFMLLRQRAAIAAVAGTVPQYQYVIIGKNGQQYDLIQQDDGTLIDSNGMKWT